MSSFTWLDYSEHDRQKALEVVWLFAEKGTVDELGIGTVRDAFSDILFPGTSTLHTRARYFFFIPWTYKRLEARQWGSAAEVAAQARKDEIALINALTESEDTEGVIGIDARETLKNLPSLVYWQGLQTIGHPVGSSATVFWHPAIPPAPQAFPQKASFQLTPTEARFLQDRARRSTRHSCATARRTRATARADRAA